MAVEGLNLCANGFLFGMKSAKLVHLLAVRIFVVEPPHQVAHSAHGIREMIVTDQCWVAITVNSPQPRKHDEGAGPLVLILLIQHLSVPFERSEVGDGGRGLSWTN